MRLIRIDAHAGDDLSMRWSFSAPGRQPFVFGQLHGEQRVALLARRNEALLVDLDFGRELWRWGLEGQDSWTDIAFDRGLFVVYENEKGGRLEGRGFR